MTQKRWPRERVTAFVTCMLDSRDRNGKQTVRMTREHTGELSSPHALVALMQLAENPDNLTEHFDVLHDNRLHIRVLGLESDIVFLAKEAFNGCFVLQ